MYSLSKTKELGPASGAPQDPLDPPLLKCVFGTIILTETPFGCTRACLLFDSMADFQRETIRRKSFEVSIRRFSKLTKFSADCHLANDWSVVLC